jgi:hypothetical protein
MIMLPPTEEGASMSLDLRERWTKSKAVLLSFRIAKTDDEIFKTL